MKEGKLKIKEILKEKDISQYELAKRLQIPSHHVTNMVKPSFNPTFKTLQKISKALECKIKELIDE